MHDDPQVWADAGLWTHDTLPESPVDRHLTVEEAAAYIRAAYCCGYADALKEPRPLPEPEARVRYARLRLDLPD